MMFSRLDLMTQYSLLNLPISCTSTVFILCLYDVGYFLSAVSVSNAGGSLLNTSAATSFTTSSDDLPPPDDALACNIIQYNDLSKLSAYTSSLYLRWPCKLMHNEKTISNQVMQTCAPSECYNVSCYMTCYWCGWPQGSLQPGGLGSPQKLLRLKCDRRKPCSYNLR